MKLPSLFFLILVCSLSTSFAQVGINTDGSSPNSSSMLDVKSINRGFLPPRMTTIQRDAIAGPVEGLVIYNTDCHDLQVFNGTAWIPMGNTGLLQEPVFSGGNISPCPNAQGLVYTVSTLAGATGYTWTVPQGAAIVSGQGTSSLTLNMGTFSGLVCVAGYTQCLKGPMACLQLSVPVSTPGSFTISVSANPVCAGTSVSFTAVPVNGGTHPVYSWYVNGNVVQTGENPQFSCLPLSGDHVFCSMDQDDACYPGNSYQSNIISMTVNPPVTPSVTIVPSANPACQGLPVSFIAQSVNGGSAPLYAWKINNILIPGATGAVYTFIPLTGDVVSCTMTSSIACAVNPAQASTIPMVMVPPTVAPAAGSHVAQQYQVIWNWNSVPGAAGYKWNTVNDFSTATEMGAALTKTETGLTCNTAYSRYVWAYNVCGNSAATTLTKSTTGCPFPCGQTITVNHTAGVVAPVTKSVTYGTATNIPGEQTKCWITRNLGAGQQASAVGDPSEEPAGWYWQFNKKQGYKHDGSASTPAWTITGIFENSSWITANDPCNIELGDTWRVPTATEWTNVDNAGGWTNWNGPWFSDLKLHAAGDIGWSAGVLYSRGSSGYYWGSTQVDNSNGPAYTMYTGGSYVGTYNKAYGLSVRCIKE